MAVPGRPSIHLTCINPAAGEAVKLLAIRRSVYLHSGMEDAMYRKVLFPTDGSETANAALREAFKFAMECASTIRLVYICEDPPYVLAEGPADVSRAIELEGKRVLMEAETLARARGIHPETVLVKAAGRRVATAIIEEAGASGCDLIVMGTHGRRGVEHLVLGSVAEAVLRRATLPVLLLRTR